jgi:hypothetical protein
LQQIYFNTSSLWILRDHSEERVSTDRLYRFYLKKESKAYQFEGLDSESTAFKVNGIKIGNIIVAKTNINSEELLLLDKF